MTRKFLFVLGSARPEGNSEILARKAAEQLPSDVEQRWLNLADLPLPDFEDRRHDDSRPRARPRPVGDNEAELLDATLEATDIVIVSPLYWYSLSATVKRYLDYWDAWLETPEVAFQDTLKGRTLWGVTALAHREEEVAEPLIGTLRNTAAFFPMHFGGVLLGNGTRPGHVLEDAEALARAKTFFAQEPPLARYPYDS
ncbi:MULTISPECIES: NAD(P)H-dependent oxidoreductase [Streptomyces]|uniref:Flavodoxin n=1 Tax=Streptomyces venezuelae TaxID=54571 RepID=A0A5P2BE58_STRVZ|nr:MULTISPECIES: NAD(P)H-dependent oxidoreductase [Streptomyces]NEA03994.1 NAD(P)H-dependent oxidoreductase [Streptomyces sp. SID10116]MYY85069.1 flavodoxin [Streptomyces sp. SID335]MYZ17264.1 flavodoxin [Streptomyces sp. SID337]NDZ87060.1 NAD(P)H-dependent oxidoreductase [Streptomyces sp. SID10115]NEB47071.1 NAD(P)H-dependent oxidoreductase [Streptomyces sp. SID339]